VSAPTSSPRDTDAHLDRETGRADDREALRLRLPTAPTDYLEGALENPDLGEGELAVLLRNRSASPALLTRVGRNRAWMRSRDLKLALITHPKTPHVLARGYLPHLAWRRLAEVAADLRLSPVVRREAEKLVRVRLPELSQGERTTLARIASRGLLEILRDDADARVMRALASNPRATEADVDRMVARPDAPPEFLGWLASQSAWGQRRGVRLALVRHPRTPIAAALKAAGALSLHDLEGLCRDSGAPRLVRIAAERRVLRQRGAALPPELG
jgi:hypothetical protein